MQGQLINGYELKHLLGQGGMAEVWYAENEIGRAAAVKILNESFTHNQQIVERFHNEALVMVKLNHPNIRQVYGYGYLGTRHCIIMEYLEGSDLEALMKSGRRFSDEELKRWWNQIADTLNYTHSRGVVHRDIKPSNLFLDNNGNIKLLDFGIAKLKESMSMTRTGTMMGTLMYMSPEQVMDSKNIDYHTDIYSLAVTFVHLLSGKAPYDSDTSGDYAVRKGIVEQEFDLSSVPAEWRGFLRPYLSKEPSRRPPLRPFEMVQDNPNPNPFVDQSTKVSTSATESAAPAVVVTNQTSSFTPETASEPKSKTGLWIGLGIGGAVLLLLLVLLLRPKPKPAYYPPVQSSQPFVQTQTSTPTTTTTTTTQQTTQTTQTTTTISTPEVNIPKGAAKGVFSVGSSKQVFFAKGNLQYRAETNEWRFANNQWETIGQANTQISSYNSDWIDLFSWGTGDYPANDSENNNDYLTFNDWGYYAVSGDWKTPTKDEWNYLFTGRPNANAKYGGARVNGVAGIVVLPDDWSNEVHFSSGKSYSANTYDISSWRQMEEAGAIFLPITGRRDGRQMFKYGTDGDYWSSSSKGVGRAYNIDFVDGKLLPIDDSPTKHGFAVRLITNK